jgi:SnoaL-like domain
MSTHELSTRRRFFGSAGAALAVPLTATALAQPATGGDDSATRLAALEATSAIRALQREYARRVNAGANEAAAHLFADPAAAPVDASLRRLAADRFAAHDVIEVAPDGATASACFECTVETETAIAGSYTLVDMLREQGDATLRSVERRVLESDYVTQGGAWKIASLVLRRA